MTQAQQAPATDTQSGAMPDAIPIAAVSQMLAAQEPTQYFRDHEPEQYDSRLPATWDAEQFVSNGIHRRWEQKRKPRRSRRPRI